jgi:hypothetical protein
MAEMQTRFMRTADGIIDLKNNGLRIPHLQLTNRTPSEYCDKNSRDGSGLPICPITMKGLKDPAKIIRINGFCYDIAAFVKYIRGEATKKGYGENIDDMFIEVLNRREELRDPMNILIEQFVDKENGGRINEDLLLLITNNLFDEWPGQPSVTRSQKALPYKESVVGGKKRRTKRRKTKRRTKRKKSKRKLRSLYKGFN